MTRQPVGKRLNVGISRLHRLSDLPVCRRQIYVQTAEHAESRTICRNIQCVQIPRCDGRTHCSQMTSCEEATWFLRNCAGTEMDGDGDGIPCEQQLCR
ncbi:excalibur calcium-binding domain-containing protein [Eikenella corrodens]|uniref:Excalibur calcium-binding domain-containing protein n=1 Tax=Eikenella corrodens TaxID=539 RepID=A0A3S9SMQ5_EIKCO|nr:excalibur calcium-binding domain-containing protein [Eikenella corrodens]